MDFLSNLKVLNLWENPDLFSGFSEADKKKESYKSYLNELSTKRIGNFFRRRIRSRLCRTCRMKEKEL